MTFVMDDKYDSLHQLPAEKWVKLQEALESDLPRCITGYNLLATQRRWLERGFNHGCTVFCPFGDVRNGMVAFIELFTFIECPNNDTKALEDALRRTKAINWKKPLIVRSTASHIVECLERISVGFKKIKLFLYILDKLRPTYDLSLPPEISFKLLSPEHVDLIASKTPYQYPGYDKHFHALINNNSGYGLFKTGELIAWVFIKEQGAIGHLYVLDEHRSNGYGEMAMKLICNVLLKENVDIFSHVSRDNEISCKLHDKIEFKIHGEVVMLINDKCDLINHCYNFV